MCRTDVTANTTQQLYCYDTQPFLHIVTTNAYVVAIIIITQKFRPFFFEMTRLGTAPITNLTELDIPNSLF
jgi:hypothetical protein